MRKNRNMEEGPWGPYKGLRGSKAQGSGDGARGAIAGGGWRYEGQFDSILTIWINFKNHMKCNEKPLKNTKITEKRRKNKCQTKENQRKLRNKQQKAKEK